MIKEASYRKFALAEFFLVVISFLALSFCPELSWLPLIFAFLPWLFRLTRIQTPFRSSPLNYLIPFFLITSFIGTLVAYNPETATHKFYLIIGSAILFFSLAQQPKENIGIIASSLSLIGVIASIIFVLIMDWSAFTADLSVVNAFGKLLIDFFSLSSTQNFIKPQFFHPNFIGGINAILVPIGLASSISLWREKKKYQLIFSLLILSILIIGLLISSSRAAWAATFIGLGVIFILGYSQQKHLFVSSQFIYVLIPSLIILIGIFWPLLVNRSLPEDSLSLTDLTSFDSRLQLNRQTYFLIADFLFTGGGLGSFPGLYSQYILAIPYFMFGYSHNLYLDMALEQGIFGLFIWISIMIVSAITIGSSIRRHSKSGKSGIFALAILASLIILLLHGILDDPVYSNSWGLMFLFVIPGIAISLSDQQPRISRSSIKKYTKFGLAGIAIIFPLLINFSSSIFATWNSNIGALNMAKIELQNWPSGEWVSGDRSDTYSQAEVLFTKSLSNNLLDQTAHYRLGLISMLGFDFQQAAEYLEVALTISPEHRGVRKNLGYCYTWLGKFNEAELLLRKIPEANSEMETYIWWWQNQNQEDFAKNALVMMEQLD